MATTYLPQRLLAARERELVLQHLEDLLASSRFHSSKRYAAFLRFIVLNALEAEVPELKERSLGIELFGRTPSYDTAADPIVRVTASEVRKKLAQYYMENQELAMRIVLPSGSYIPEFHFTHPEAAAPKVNEPNNSAAPDAETSSQAAVKVIPLGIVPPPAKKPKIAFRWQAILWLSLAANLLLVAGFAAYHERHLLFPTAYDHFWAPILSAPEPVQISMGELHVLRAELDPNGPYGGQNDPLRALFDLGITQSFWSRDPNDTIAVAHLAGAMRNADKRFAIRGEATTNFDELRSGPVILVGAFNNNWSMRLMKLLRYRFEMDTAAHSWWISDAQKPNQHLADFHEGHLTNSLSPDQSDYALIARVVDPQTQQPVVIVAGLGINATSSAGEFVSSPKAMEALTAQAPPHWEKKNVELLLALNVVDGSNTVPRLIASYFW